MRSVIARRKKEKEEADKEQRRAQQMEDKAKKCVHSFQVLTKEWQTQDYYTDPAARSRYAGSVLSHRREILFCPYCELTLDPLLLLGEVKP